MTVAPGAVPQPWQDNGGPRPKARTRSAGELENKQSTPRTQRRRAGV